MTERQDEQAAMLGWKRDMAPSIVEGATGRPSRPIEPEPCLCGEKMQHECEMRCAVSEGQARGSGSEDEVSDDRYRAVAAKLISTIPSTSGDVDVDATVSRGSEDGAYVACWVWVPRAIA